MDITLSKKKETKNTVQFESSDPNLPTVYVGKEGLETLGNPEKIKVTIEAATT